MKILKTIAVPFVFIGFVIMILITGMLIFISEGSKVFESMIEAFKNSYHETRREKDGN